MRKRIKIPKFKIGDIIYCKDLLAVCKVYKRPCIVVGYGENNKLKVLYITHREDIWDYKKEKLDTIDVENFKLNDSYTVLNIFEPLCTTCIDYGFKSKITDRLKNKLKTLNVI